MHILHKLRIAARGSRQLCMGWNLGTRLRASDLPLANEVAAALDQTKATLHPDHQSHLQRIEACREAYVGSSEAVEQVDFGAGQSGEADTAEPRVRHLSLSQYVAVSKSPPLGLLLSALTRELAPERVLELGTAVGISGAYLLAGLEASQASDPALVSLEGAPAAAAVAQRTWDTVGLTCRREVVLGAFEESLQDALAIPYGLAFVDGNHRRDPTVEYGRALANSLTTPGIIVFDDIAWSAGMREAWGVVKRLPGTCWTLDLVSIGLVVLDGSAGTPRDFHGWRR